MRLSSSKAPSKGKRYLLTSYNVNDVTECVPHEVKGNVTLMAKSPKQEVYFAYCILTKAPIVCSRQNKVHTMFTTVSIHNKNTRKLRNVVNPRSKKFNFSYLFLVFMFQQKLLENWEKNNPS